jgi:type II secretion system protein N
MKEKLRRIAPKVGLPLFYLFALVLFARWTFPYEKLRDRVVLSYNQQQRETNSQQELKIDELGPSWLTGFRASGVTLLSAASEAGKPPSELKVDQVRAYVAPLRYLFGHLDVSVDIDSFGGTIEGELDESSKERKIEVTVESVNLSEVPMVVDALGVPVDGTLGGTVKLNMADAKASKTTGAVSIELKGVAIGDGKAKLKGYLALPRLVIGDVTLTGEARDGILKISKVTAGGKDVELQGEGRVQLREVIPESFCDLNLRFKINDAYRTKNDTTKSLFGAPGSSMPALFEMDPKVKQSKQTNGFYGWHMHGACNKPDFDPAPFASPAGGPAGGMMKGAQ